MQVAAGLPDEADEGRDPFAVDPVRALAAINFTWGDAYLTEYTEEGGWMAWRRDGRGDAITAPGPDRLIAGIREDWDFRPVRLPDPRPAR